MFFALRIFHFDVPVFARPDCQHHWVILSIFQHHVFFDNKKIELCQRLPHQPDFRLRGKDAPGKLRCFFRYRRQNRNDQLAAHPGSNKAVRATATNRHIFQSVRQHRRNLIFQATGCDMLFCAIQRSFADVRRIDVRTNAALHQINRNKPVVAADVRSDMAFRDERRNRLHSFR